MEKVAQGIYAVYITMDTINSDRSCVVLGAPCPPPPLLKICSNGGKGRQEKEEKKKTKEEKGEDTNACKEEAVSI